MIAQRHAYVDGMHIANCLLALPNNNDEEGSGMLQVGLGVGMWVWVPTKQSSLSVS